MDGMQHSSDIGQHLVLPHESAGALLAGQVKAGAETRRLFTALGEGGKTVK